MARAIVCTSPSINRPIPMAAAAMPITRAWTAKRPKANSGVDPLSWTPEHLGNRSSRWQSPKQTGCMRRSSGGRWSSWFGADVIPRNWLGNSSLRRRRSAIGLHKPIAMQAGGPMACIAIGLCNPIADRLRRRLEFPSQFLGITSAPNQLDHLPPELRRIQPVCFGLCHRELLFPKCSGVHESGSTPLFAFGRFAVHARVMGIAAAAIGIGRLIEGDVQTIALAIAVDEVFGNRLTVLPAGGDAQVRQRQQPYPHQPLGERWPHKIGQRDKWSSATMGERLPEEQRA